MGDSRNGPIPKSLRLFCAVTSLLAMGYCARFWRLPTQVEMNHKMNYFKIWPDVVAKKANLSFIRVQFRQTVTVVLGNKVHVKALGDKPHSITWKADNNTLHTLLLVDPDWPIKEPRTVNEFPHWMVGNIPGNNVEKGETIFDYVGYRATVVDKEPHRYTFVAYRQPGEEPIKFDEPRLNDTQVWEREVFRNFSAIYLQCKYNLTPVAINFFLVDQKEIYLDDNTDLESLAAFQIGAVTSPNKENHYDNY